MHSVFVYGTLKRGYCNHYLMKDETNGTATFVADAVTVEKYPLVIATEFYIPFLLNEPGKGKNVRGEIWKVDDEMLATLDKLEQHPSWYTRNDVEVMLQDEEKSRVNCMTYLLHDFNPDLLTHDYKEEFRNKEFKYVGSKTREDFDFTVVKKK